MINGIINRSVPYGLEPGSGFAIRTLPAGAFIPVPIEGFLNRGTEVPPGAYEAGALLQRHGDPPSRQHLLVCASCQPHTILYICRCCKYLLHMYAGAARVCIQSTTPFSKYCVYICRPNTPAKYVEHNYFHAPPTERRVERIVWLAQRMHSSTSHRCRVVPTSNASVFQTKYYWSTIGITHVHSTCSVYTTQCCYRAHAM